MLTPTQIAKLVVGVAAWLLLAVDARAALGTAVEYRHVDWGYYFITASPGEAAVLDGGAFNGAWQRTGQTFAVHTEPGQGLHPTCRFFSTSFAPKGSHFYSPYANECEIVLLNPDWQYEAISFHVALPDANGQCATGTTALYRLYNNGAGGAPNHRYAASLAVFEETRAAGWTPEGHPQTNVLACVPQAPTSGSAVGPWIGTTDSGNPVRGFVLEDRSYWFVVTSKAGDPLHVIQGSASTAAGVFASSDGKNFAVTSPGSPGTTYAVTISGTFVEGSTLQLAITGGPTGVITATYDTGTYDPIANLAAAAGSFGGKTGHVAGAYQTTFAIDLGGGLAGQSNSCNFVGALVPSGTAPAMNLSITGVGGQCVTGTGQTRQGLAYYNTSNGLFYGFVPVDGRNDCYFIVGGKQ